MDKRTAKSVILLDGDTEAFARRTGEADTVELVIVTQSGEHRPVKLTLHPQVAQDQAAA